jgi:pimeloyl-ACP methyl ester carboxylesterase
MLRGNDIDTCVDDLAALTDVLDLRNVIHVGHSTGGGSIVGTERPAPKTGILQP